MEVWKEIPDYEGYAVSDRGRVKSLARTVPHPLCGEMNLVERILKTNIDSDGYKRLSIRQYGKTVCFRVHQFVAMAFLGHVPNGHDGLIVDHIDHDKLNNNFSNIQIVTHRTNITKDRNKGLPAGVSITPNGKYYARAGNNYKTKCLGTYDTPEMASEAYLTYLNTL